MFRLFYLFFFWGVVILNLAKSIQWHRTFRHTYNSHLRKHRVILLYESGDVFRSPELCILFGCDQPNLQCDLTSDLGAVHHDKVGGGRGAWTGCQFADSSWKWLSCLFTWWTHTAALYQCCPGHLDAEKWHRMCINSTVLGSRFLQFPGSWFFPPCWLHMLVLDRTLSHLLWSQVHGYCVPCLCWING